MLTEQPNPDNQDEEDDYYVPQEDSPGPIRRAEYPNVKRFNRKTMFVMVGAIGLATVLAFGTALTREHMRRKAEAEAALKATASMSANDAINALPSDYGQMPPKLGPPLPGDIGEIAKASQTNNGQPSTAYPNNAIAGQQRPLDPMEQYEQQRLLEEYKRQVRAREGGFTFANSAGGQGAALPVNSPVNPGEAINPQGLNGKGTDIPDEDNLQDEKRAFLNSGPKDFKLSTTVQYPKSPYTMFSGTIIPGVLITGINSDLPGQIEGTISQNVYDTVTGNHLLLPQGTKIIGEYDSRVTYGQQRVLVVWTRLIRPDGSNISLEGMPGVDMSGYAGMVGDIDRHLLRLLGAVVLGSALQAGAQSGTSVGLGTQTFSDRARQGLGSGISSSTNQMVRKELQLQPTITVEPGERFNVFVTKDIVIPPFKG